MDEKKYFGFGKDCFAVFQDGALTINVGVTTTNCDVIINGDCTINGDLTVNGDATINGDLEVNGDATINGDLSVNGDGEISGDLNVGGSVTGSDGTFGGVNVPSHTHAGVHGVTSAPN